MQFVVCRYKPAGNLMNTFQVNVKPPTKTTTLNNNDLESNKEEMILPTKSQQVLSQPQLIKDNEPEPEKKDSPITQNEDEIIRNGMKLIDKMKEEKIIFMVFSP